MNTFQPNLDILPDSQRALWPSLAPLQQLRFVLYGGTAIALRLGHRVSVDFDFFSSQPLNKTDLFQVLPDLATATPLQDEPDAFSVLVGGVKLSFFGGLRFGHYSPPEKTQDGNLVVAALDDLMALKLKVVLQRSEAKDYLDIAAMLRHGIRLDRGLAIAEAMFRPQFAPMVALRALTYFEDGDLDALPLADRNLLVSTVGEPLKLPEARALSPELL